jgi:hypothetical protein
MIQPLASTSILSSLLRSQSVIVFAPSSVSPEFAIASICHRRMLTARHRLSVAMSPISLAEGERSRDAFLGHSEFFLEKSNAPFCTAVITIAPTKIALQEQYRFRLSSAVTDIRFQEEVPSPYQHFRYGGFKMGRSPCDIGFCLWRF